MHDTQEVLNESVLVGKYLNEHKHSPGGMLIDIYEHVTAPIMTWGDANEYMYHGHIAHVCCKFCCLKVEEIVSPIYLST